MIIGIGSDICDIRRIEKSLARHGERFKKRLFTEKELARAARKALEANTLAKRFAAKEACSKALGTGFSNGVFWKDLGVDNLRSGAPTMTLTNGALAILNRKTPAGYTAKIHLTMTDEYPYAMAHVYIEAILAPLQPE